MLFESTFKTVATSAQAVYKCKGSKFIAHIFNFENENEFRNELIKIQQQHTKANHHCYAWRLTTDRRIFRVNDDGEPAGSAGKPILNVMLSADVTQCGCVVTRYFGGTLLGVPGLISAYKTAAEEALNTAGIVELNITEQHTIEFNHEWTHFIHNLLKQHQATIISNQQNQTCLITFKVNKAKALHLTNLLLSEFPLKGNVLFKN